MKFERLYIVKLKTEQDQFGVSKIYKSGIEFKIESDKFSFKQRFGKAITTEVFNQLFLSFMQSYTLHEPLKIYRRSLKYRFVFRSGQSGCQDTFIETSDGGSFPKRKKIIHESMCNKVNEKIECFLYDLLDLFVSCGYFQRTKDNYVFPMIENNIYIKNIIIVEPRDIEKEIGWTNPEFIAPAPILMKRG